MVEDGLGDPACRDRHLLTLADICDLPLAQRLLNRRFYLGSGSRQEPLSIAEALALRVRPTIDDIHRLSPSRRL
jgi:hypothetical protein